MKPSISANTTHVLHTSKLVNRLMFSILFAILILLGVVFAIFLTNTAQRNQQENEAALLRLQTALQGEIESQKSISLALASDASSNAQIQQVFAERNRTGLQTLTLPTFELADNLFSVGQYQFILPPATSFLRLHQLDLFGDDLSGFRETVLAAHESRSAVQGLEIGRGGLGVRSVLPVYYKGTYIGLIDVGIDLGETFLENIKELYKVDTQILLEQQAAATGSFPLSETAVEGLVLQASTFENPIYNSQSNYARVLNGETLITRITIDGRTYAQIAFPLYDFSNKIIGVIEIFQDQTELLAEQRTTLIWNILIGLGLLVVIGTSLYVLLSRNLQPLTVLTENAQAVAGGDLTRRNNINRNDEIGALAVSFDAMTEQLQTLINSLEQRVATRTKDLETVSEISKNTATILDPFQMVATAVHLTQRGFNLYHAHVFEYNKTTGELQIVACGYKEGDEHEGTHGTVHIPLQSEQSLVARAARTRKPVIVNDVRSDPGWLPNPLLPETRAELAVPMVVGDELIGVLDVQSEYVDAFNEEDATIQLTLAAQLAVAMKNAQSYSATRDQAKLETLVNTIGQKIQRAGTVEDTLQIAIRELGLALGASRVKARIENPDKAAAQETAS